MNNLFSVAFLLICTTSLFAQNNWKWGNYGDSTFFPITTYLQATADIDAYQEAGFNVYSGFWYGLSIEILADLRAKKMHYIANWEKHATWPSSNMEIELVAQANINDSLFIAWGQMDEPDNAQSDGNGGFGGCVDPQIIINFYNEINTFDTTGRQVLLNCGVGVSRIDAYNRGNECSGKTEMYNEYYKGCDIASYDIYPVSNSPSPMVTNDELWYVGTGVKNMREFTNDSNDAYWFYLECTDITGNGKATPEQIWVEAWNGIIAGGTGIQWFPFTVSPNVHNPRALLEDSEMMDAVENVNRAVYNLATVINSETIEDIVDIELLVSKPWDIPKISVEYMVKHFGDTLYIFTVGTKGSEPNIATFTIKTNNGPKITSKVIVMQEDREIEIVDKQFTQEYLGQEVHLFKIGGISKDMIVGIDDNSSDSVNKYSLKQNYPNPFNSTTTINYSIPESGLVKLSVYNLLGQEVEELVNEVKVLGNYSNSFNASKLSTGVYFYKIQVGNYSKIYKMITIK